MKRKLKEKIIIKVLVFNGNCENFCGNWVNEVIQLSCAFLQFAKIYRK